MESEDFQSLSSTPETKERSSLENRKRIFLQTVHLSVSTVVSQVARFIKNLLLAGILGPASFGVWNGLQVFITYGMNSHLGVLQAMGREIPLRRGSGKIHEIPGIAITGFTVSVISALIGGVLTAGLALWGILSESGDVIPALLIIPVIVAQMVFIFGQFLLRSMDEFEALSRVLLLAAPLELIATVGFAYSFGLNGVLIGLALSQALGALLSLKVKRSFSLKLRIDWLVARAMIRVGFPIVLTVLGYFVLTTIDRLFIISLAGSEQLGYYSLGSLAIAALGYIPIAVSQVMFPKFASRFGETRDPAALAGYLRIPTLLTAHTMGFVLGSAVICLPIVIILIPKYAPGIPAATYLLAGFYFVGLTGSTANLMLTIGRHKQYLLFLSGAIVLAALLDVVALSRGWGIEGVALVTGVVNLVYAFSFIHFSVKEHLPAQAHPFGFLQVKLLVPWFLAVLLVGLVSFVSLESGLVTAIVRVLLFGAVYAPISVWVTRREKLW